MSGEIEMNGADDLRIRLLGGLRVHVGGREIEELGRWKRPAAVLKLLALAPGHAIHREVAQDVLWPDLDGESAANNLHGTLHLLRRLFEPRLRRGSESRFVVLQGNLLRLHAPGCLWIDTEAFALAVNGARRWAEWAAYEAALALYVADLLPEDAYADWAAAQRDALRSQFLSALRELAALYEAAGQFASAVRTLERLVHHEPTDEDAAAQLIQLHMRLGQHQLAIRQFQQLERALQRDLDCTPDAQLIDLRDQILRSPTPAVRSVPSAISRAAQPLAHLTERERQIGHLLARGLSNRCIAATLGMSPRTAETHVSRILRKLDVRSREQVVLVLGRS